jgi:uncharacterized membrane protein YdjX (TVP38/TMEM64 family)
MQTRSHRKFVIISAISLVILAIAAGVVVFKYRTELPSPDQLRYHAESFLNSVPPLLYFLAFAILPAIGVPLTMFYLTAIPVLGGVHPVIGILIALTAVALNMTLTNLLARSVLHPGIEWVIRHRQLSIPKIQPANEWKVVLATRLSPIPFALQNYLLALGHARWRNYLGLSMLVQGAIGVAMMLVGESILSGGLGYILLALFAFLLLNLLSDYLRKRFSDREPSE